MADLIIRGMEMPKHCIDCPLMVDRFDTDACALQSQEANEAFESWEDMRRSCPLLPIPAGYGRLIDADALIRDKSSEANLWCGYEYQDHYVVFEEDIKNAPTIIPAEGGTENG